MAEPIVSWTKLFVVPAFYAVVITVFLSPLLLWLYRRRVTRWMARPGDEPAAAPPEDTSAPPAMAWRRLEGAAVAAGRRPGPMSPGPASVGRIVAGYAAGGLACAVVLTVCFGIAFVGQVSTAVLYTAFLVFLLPVLATGLYLVSARVGVRVGAFVAAGGLLYGLLGYRQDLGLTLFTGFVLLPVVLLVVFSLRFWRGVAPMVMILALPASLLAVAAVEFGVAGLGLPPAWPWRLLGFGAGAGLGYAALRILQRAYEARRFSDLELFVDTWWLLYLLQQTTIFLLMRPQAFYLVALLGGVPFVLLRRLSWRVLPVPAADRPAADLLLLRVFAESGRTRTLFDRLERRWRHIGHIRMIAGWDLALRNIGPADFVAFLGGRLKRQFVRDERDLAVRLQSLRDGRDADGRYRVEHFWCHANTWRATMRALVARSDAVLMDLRGFTGDREGCRYELLHLARHAPGKPVLLLVDDAKAYVELQRLLGGSVQSDASWIVADVGDGERQLEVRLVELLAPPGR